MARGKLSGNNGGLFGSGIFGLFGTVIKCDSKDESIYCNIMKLFNLLIVIFVVIFIFYYVYHMFISPLLYKKR